MQFRKSLLLSTLVVSASAASIGWASVNADLPAEQHVGRVTYLTGGGTPGQQQVMQSDATHYPLELQFIWGRGAKETLVPVSAWTIRDSAGHVLVAGHSGGPIVLASLPSGRYIVRATYDGDTIARTVHVRRGATDDVLLEWPE